MTKPHAPVEDAVAVHVVHRLQKLVHVVLHRLLGQMLRAPLDQLVYVALHELKHERQAACGLVVKHLVQLHDVVVRRQPAQRLNLAKVINLLQALKHVFHALNGHERARFDRLRLNHLGKCPLSHATQARVLVHCFTGRWGRCALRGGWGRGGGVGGAQVQHTHWQRRKMQLASYATILLAICATIWIPFESKVDSSRT